MQKTKRIAKFGGLQPWRCEDIKGIVTRHRPKIFSGLLINRPLIDFVKTAKSHMTLHRCLLKDLPLVLFG